MKVTQYLNEAAIKVAMKGNEMVSRAGAALLALVTAILPLTAAEAQNLGAIGETVAKSGKGMKTMFLTVFAVIGFALVGIGLIKWKNAKQSGESLGGIIGMIAIGALLMAIPAIIATLGTTVFGTDTTKSALDGLG